MIILGFARVRVVSIKTGVAITISRLVVIHATTRTCRSAVPGRARHLTRAQRQNHAAHGGGTVTQAVCAARRAHRAAHMGRAQPKAVRAAQQTHPAARLTEMKDPAVAMPTKLVAPMGLVHQYAATKMKFVIIPTGNVCRPRTALRRIAERIEA